MRSKRTVFIIILSLIISLNGCHNSNRQVQNIEAFTKVYGYVRWFHPSDEAQTVDWEKFAVYGVSKVKEAKSPESLRDTLLKLFKPIAPSINISLKSDNYKFNNSVLTPSDTNINKCIAWQHLGVDLNVSEPYIYKSKRTNRIIINDIDKYYQLYHLVISDNYRHKNVILSFESKCNRGGELCAFLLTGDLNKITRYPKIINSKVFNDTIWKINHINTKWGDAEALVFGVFNRGKSDIYLDNFKLKVQTERGWEEVKIENGNLNSAIPKSNPLTFITRSNSLYKVSRNKRNLKDDDYCICIKPSLNTFLFDKYPEVGELVKKELPRGLKLTMPIALFGDSESTYPVADKNELNKLQNSLLQSFTEADERLGAIVITWNVFQHFYPYFKEVCVDWNGELSNTINEVLTMSNDDLFVYILQRLTAKIKDGHIQISSEKDNIYTGFLPITWEWIDDNLVVTSVLNKNTSLKVGDIVTNINGICAKSYFEDIKQYISASTPGHLKLYCEQFSLKRPLNIETTLTIINSQGDKTDIKIENTSNLTRIVNSVINKSKYKVLNDSIYYINPSKIDIKEFNGLLPELERSRGVIFDLRSYPRLSHLFLEHLMINEDTVSNWIQIPKYIYPDQKNIIGYQYEGLSLKPRKPHISAPIVFLTNSDAISYCESILSIVKHYNLGVIVGENTAGTNGNINQFTLPLGYKICFTGMKVTKLDGSQFHGVGIAPDFVVHKTINGIREGRDEFMEKAIEIIEAM